MSGVRLVLAAAILIGLLSVAVENGAAQSPGAAPVEKKNVLVLFPYNCDLPYVLLSEKTLREEISEAADVSLTLYNEHLDLLRFRTPEYQTEVIRLLKLKYKGVRMDLVIVANEAMLDLWLAERGDFGPLAPVVFFDINIERVKAKTLPPNVFGVGAKVDYRPTIDWLRKLHRPFKEIALVYGTGQTDKSFRQPIENLLNTPGYQDGLIDLSNKPFPEMKRFISEMKPGSVVLFHLLFEDVAGARFAPINALQELIAVSPVPVLIGHDQFVGTGAVGGYTYSIEAQTREAAILGFKILRGQSAGSVGSDKGNKFIFDHAALRRFNIRLTGLPPDSILKNRQFSIFELYGTEITAVSVLVIVLSLLVVFLTVQSRRLKKAQVALALMNADLESQVARRTEDLSTTNERLREEISVRVKAEKSLSDALAERGILLKELNHRIKNNLQIVLSLIRMSTSSESSSENTVLAEAAGRIETIANVHESFNPDAAALDITFDDYLERIAAFSAEMHAGGSPIKIEVKASTGVSIPMKTAANIGLLVNELITNAYKYAFPGGRSGTIYVQAAKDEHDRVLIELSDDGVGMDESIPARPGSLGMGIVHSLADGLNARLSLESVPGKGTRWAIDIPLVFRKT